MKFIHSRLQIIIVAVLVASNVKVDGFSVHRMSSRQQSPSARAFAIQQYRSSSWTTSLQMAAPVETTATKGGFIETELRGQAMKLHTRSQAPKEGEAEEKKREPYTPTQADYLAFLVDSQHVYKAFEDVVNERDELKIFRNTGLERVEPLEKDIEFMTQEFDLKRPDVGMPGSSYADEIRNMGKEGKIEEFLCHYYNHYFAHTAGGRMIGKQMSALLLNKKTLEFYKVRRRCCT